MRFVLAPLAAVAFLGAYAGAQATVHIEVDLATQTMHVEGSHGDYDWPVSTGRPGFRTPTGVYREQRMYVMHHSAEYENAPMPHAIFFNGGYAIHGTYATGALGQVASHGCIRLAPGNAAALFDMVKHEGASIVISGSAPGRDRVAAAPRHREYAAAAPSHREVVAVAQTPVDEVAPASHIDEVAVLPLRDDVAAAPHRAGHRLAAEMRGRYRQEALGYAPRARHTERSLRSWADNPLENQ